MQRPVGKEDAGRAQDRLWEGEGPGLASRSQILPGLKTLWKQWLFKCSFGSENGYKNRSDLLCFSNFAPCVYITYSKVNEKSFKVLRSLTPRA